MSKFHTSYTQNRSDLEDFLLSEMNPNPLTAPIKKFQFGVKIKFPKEHLKD